MHPNTVGHDPGRQGMIGITKPLSVLQPPAVLLRHLWPIHDGIEYSQESSGYRLIFFSQVVAANVD